jgi:glycosidase
MTTSLGSYYSVQDYQAVNPEFGTEADFKAVVVKAHELGMKVISDWVANHTAWDNPWIKEHRTGTCRTASGTSFPPSIGRMWPS